MDNRALLECVAQVLERESKPLHVNDLAIYLADDHPTLNREINDLPTRLSQCLSVEVKKPDSRFRKPKNKQGGLRKGVYQLKLKRPQRPSLPNPVAPAVTSQYTGKAGEHAVLSELLFWGFNASLMAVDDGIDVVASRDNRYYHIQVKTANESGANGAAGYTFTVRRSKFEEKHSAQTFYIFVLRRFGNSGYRTDYVVLPSSEVVRLRDAEVLSSGDILNFRITEGPEGFLLNRKEVINRCINAFNIIC